MKDYEDQFESDDELHDDEDHLSNVNESDGFSNTPLGNIVSSISNSAPKGISDYLEMINKNQNSDELTPDAPKAETGDQAIDEERLPESELTGSVLADDLTSDTPTESVSKTEHNGELETNTPKPIVNESSVKEVDEVSAPVIESTESASLTDDEPETKPLKPSPVEEDEELVTEKIITGTDTPEVNNETVEAERFNTKPKMSDIRQTVNSDSLSPDLDTNGAAPLHLANDTKYNNMYRTRRSLQGTVKCLKNKSVRNLSIGNSVNYEIDKENGKTIYDVEVFRTKQRIEVTESENHIEFKGPNYKEQASMLVNYAKDVGWMDLAVWGDTRFIDEVKKLGLKHQINVIPVGTKNEALNVKVVPKQEFNIFSSPSLGKHRPKQPTTPPASNPVKDTEAKETTASKAPAPVKIEEQTKADDLEKSKLSERRSTTTFTLQ